MPAFITQVWVVVDYEQNNYAASGYVISSVFDVGETVTSWGNISWNPISQPSPSDTFLTLQTRTGPEGHPTPDGSWSGWSASYTTPTGQAITSPVGRYIQYEANLSSSNHLKTATLDDVTIRYTGSIVETQTWYATSRSIAFNVTDDFFGPRGLRWKWDADPGDLVTPLVGDWHLDEGTGTSAADSSGYLNNGTMNGTNYWTSSGKYGAALEASGDDYVSVADSNSLDLTSAYTLEAWVKPGNTGKDQMIIDKTTDGTGGYSLFISGTNGHLQFRVYGATQGVLEGTTDLRDSTDWRHVVGTFDGTTMKVYVNGVPEGSLAWSTPANANNTPLYIGARYDDDGVSPITPQYYFSGRIDEVKIYNRGLSATEVLQRYGEGASVLHVTGGDTGGATFPSAEGKHTLHVRGYNNANPVNMAYETREYWYDPTPPGNWANFTKTANILQPTVTIQVSDTASGLKVDTGSAMYQYSTDGGTNWSAWTNATVTGSNGTTTPQTITASNVPFNQASNTQNKIRFKISDVVGNTGFSADYIVDTVGPVVQSTDPANGDTLIVTNKVVKAYFSERMDSSTITTANFTLVAGATPILGTVRYFEQGASYYATFTPSTSTPLSCNTTYTATITTGAKDFAGNNLVPNAYNIWSFTTDGIEGAITSPRSYARLSGNVAITGTANGVTHVPSQSVDFKEYRLEYGVGENPGPGDWHDIGTNPRTTKVVGDTLGTWDTTADPDGAGPLGPPADGQYTIRLTVTNNADPAHSLTYTTPVTVDNTKATATISSPTEGAYVTGTTTVSGIANDALTGVQKVQVKIDNGSWQDASGSNRAEETAAAYAGSWSNAAAAWSQYSSDDGNVDISTAGQVSLKLGGSSGQVTLRPNAAGSKTKWEGKYPAGTTATSAADRTNIGGSWSVNTLSADQTLTADVTLAGTVNAAVGSKLITGTILKAGTTATSAADRTNIGGSWSGSTLSADQTLTADVTLDGAVNAAAGSKLITGTILKAGTTATSAADRTEIGWSGIALFADRTLTADVTLAGTVNAAVGSKLITGTILKAGTTATSAADRTNIGGSWSGSTLSADQTLTADVTLVGTVNAAVGSKLKTGTILKSTGANWDKVDEATPDDDATYIYTRSAIAPNSPDIDLYNTANPIPAGATINSVKIYARGRSDLQSGPIYIGFNDGSGNFWWDGEHLPPADWTTFDTGPRSTNPRTGSPWTWAQIDALQIGVKSSAGTAGIQEKYYCTQVYVVVDYTGTQYAASGSVISSVFDAEEEVSSWGNISWNPTSQPSGTSLTLQTKTGNTPTPDGTWSDWSTPYTTPTGQAITSPVGRYIQYKAALSASDNSKTPTLTNVTMPSFAASSVSQNYSTDATTPATATFTFTGTSVTWISTRASDRGIAKISIDGTPVTNGTVALPGDTGSNKSGIDLYNAITLWQQPVYTKSGLSSGSHTLKVEVTGTRNDSSDGTRVDIDAFEIDGTIDGAVNAAAGSKLITGTILKAGTTATSATDRTEIGGSWSVNTLSADQTLTADVTLAGTVNAAVGSKLITGTILKAGTTATSAADRTNIGGSWSGSTLSADQTLTADVTLDPWNYSWNTASVSDGSHEIRARATDRAGNVGVASSPVTVTVGNNAMPYGEITSPPNMSFVDPGFTLSGFAVNHDPGGPDTTVQIYVTKNIDSFSPVTESLGPATTLSWNAVTQVWDWTKTNINAGSDWGWFALYAEIRDKSGNLFTTGSVQLSVDTEAPPAPVLSGLPDHENGCISLSWTPVVDQGSGIDYYIISRSDRATGDTTDMYYYDDTAVNDFEAGKVHTSAILDKSFSGGSTVAYTYQVQAVDYKGNKSPLSNTCIVSYDSSAPEWPGGLANLQVNRAGETNATYLTWQAATDNINVAEYKLYRQALTNTPPPSANESNLIATISAAQASAAPTKFYDSATEAGKTYYYQIVAYDEQGNQSAASNIASAETRSGGTYDLPHKTFNATPDQCVICHRVHTSQGKNLLSRSYGADLCSACHDGTASNNATKQEFDYASSSGHRVKDDIWPNGALSCTDCHNPHLNPDHAVFEGFENDSIGTSVPDGWTAGNGSWSVAGDSLNHVLTSPNLNGAFINRNIGADFDVAADGANFATKVRLDTGDVASFVVGSDGSSNGGLVARINATTGKFSLLNGSSEIKSVNVVLTSGTWYRIKVNIDKDRNIIALLASVTSAYNPATGFLDDTDTTLTQMKAIAPVGTVRGKGSVIQLGAGGGNVSFDNVRVNFVGMLTTRYRKYYKEGNVLADYLVPEDKTTTEEFCLACHGSSLDSPSGSHRQYYTSVHNPLIG